MQYFDKAPTYVYTYLSRYSKSRTSGGYYQLPDQSYDDGLYRTEDFFCQIGTYTGNSSITYRLNPDLVNLDGPNEQGSGIVDLEVSHDGRYVFYTDKYNAVVYKINLTVDFFFGDDAWEYDANSPFSINTGESTNTLNDLYGICFADSGSKLYAHTGSYNNSVDYSKIVYYTLTVPYDLSTATKVSEFTTTSEGSTDQAIGEISSDGTKYFTASTRDSWLVRYDLSTPWDISTATYNSRFNLNCKSGFSLSESGASLYKRKDVGVMSRYSMSNYDITTLVLDTDYNIERPINKGVHIPKEKPDQTWGMRTDPISNMNNVYITRNAPFCCSTGYGAPSDRPSDLIMGDWWVAFVPTSQWDASYIDPAIDPATLPYFENWGQLTGEDSRVFGFYSFDPCTTCTSIEDIVEYAPPNGNRPDYSMYDLKNERDVTEETRIVFRRKITAYSEFYLERGMTTAWTDQTSSCQGTTVTGTTDGSSGWSGPNFNFRTTATVAAGVYNLINYTTVTPTGPWYADSNIECWLTTCNTAPT